MHSQDLADLIPALRPIVFQGEYVIQVMVGPVGVNYVMHSVLVDHRPQQFLQRFLQMRRRLQLVLFPIAMQEQRVNNVKQSVEHIQVIKVVIIQVTVGGGHATSLPSPRPVQPVLVPLEIFVIKIIFAKQMQDQQTLQRSHRLQPFHPLLRSHPLQHYRRRIQYQAKYKERMVALLAFT